MSSTPYILNDRAQALAHYPHARRVGDLIFVSGVSCRRPDNTHVGVTRAADGTILRDIATQTEAVIQNIARILEEAGAGLEHLVDITTFLIDMNDFEGYNQAYNRFFDADTGPTRTTVAVHQLPHPNLAIEMKAVAYLPLSQTAR
ncbi:2-aminomuconate deaminase [Lujinxingia litoralis]|uniref:2-aminomuconate deaminase n=1 Tax=Lujinxingia litoralis TaxID=2211119 RepID=A0A328C6E8_9DELT|nr:RidA family protein [Lujinxingia litoralis]RAL22138.1 2-aminomuconate deaminase [Lujinxingia litoralis]